VPSETATTTAAPAGSVAATTRTTPAVRSSPSAAAVLPATE
jgi:hypothetical protein